MGACPVIVSLALFLDFMFIQCMRYITALIIFKKKLKISPLLLKFVLMTYRAAVYFTAMILLYKPFISCCLYLLYCKYLPLSYL